MSKRGDTVLIIDDDVVLLPTLARTLELSGYRTLTSREFRDGERILMTENVDVLLLDYLLPGIEGLEALEVVHREHPLLPVIMITGSPGYPLAVQAMKLGAFDFVPKPFDPPDKLLVAVRNAAERTRLERERQSLIDSLLDQYPILGDSPAIQTLKYKLNRVAQRDEPVLLLGETGTGKELAARAIHAGSRRAAKPYVPVNCPAVSRELIESELFGHKKGSFTGAIADKVGKFKAADGGTIFLDEIGDMDPGLQAKVLRALESKEIEPVGGAMPEKVDVRIIAATNKDLPQLVSEGRFRQDLYYRLNGVTIPMPTLRDHVEDIPTLLQFFLARKGSEANQVVPQIQPSALEALTRYPWPGNVRELDRFAGWVMTWGGPEITARDVNEWQGQSTGSAEQSENSADYRAAKDDFERDYFGRLLKLYDGNISAVSRHAGLDRAGLYRKLKSLGLVDPGLQ